MDQGMLLIRHQATILAVACLLALGPFESSVRAQVQVKSSNVKCRNHIGSTVQTFVARALSLVDQCYAQPSSLPCDQVNGLRPGAVGSAPSSFARAENFAAGITNAWCVLQSEILANYPAAQSGGNRIDLVGPQVRLLVDASAATLQGAALPRGGEKSARAKRRCIRTIGRTRTAIVNHVLKQAIRCQRSIDRTATSFGIISPTCLGSPAHVGRYSKSIARACAGFAGPDLGSCGPLPDCAIASATQTGHDLAVATYGARADQRGQLCGNGVADPGETCDDGAANSPTGACTDQCQKARCGDGEVEAGVEECDPGHGPKSSNPITTDPDCNSDCKFTTCGDGVIQTGMTRRPDEQCDDGNTVAGDGCSPTCQFEGVSCPAGGTIDVTVTFVSDTSTFSEANIAGIQLSVAYPTSVSFPGTDFLPEEDPSDPASRLILLGAPYDLYDSGALITFFDSGTFIGTAVAGGTLNAQPGFVILNFPQIPFERIRFDCVSDAELTAAMFPCTFQGMTNALGNAVPPDQRPDCKITLSR
jgi:cysteine-rich repeat protein